MILEARETFNLAVFDILLSFTCFLIPEERSDPLSMTGYSITEEKKEEKRKEGRKEGRKDGRRKEDRQAVIVLINKRKNYN